MKSLCCAFMLCLSSTVYAQVNDVPEPGTAVLTVDALTPGGARIQVSMNLVWSISFPPRCGDNIRNQAEVCDGIDDSECPGACRDDCTCLPICGDNMVNTTIEDCDGSDDSACPGLCLADCTCSLPPICGDNMINTAGEACDGVDDAVCPGACRSDCSCPPPLASQWLSGGLWLDTAPLNSMQIQDDLFLESGDNSFTILSTTSTETNIHSHYVGHGTPGRIKYTGRMMRTRFDGGLGVTFLSQYPHRDAYYRLRVNSGEGFTISTHNASITGGISSTTGVVPEAGVWYAFRIETNDTGIRTEIRANVWPSNDPEPDGWMIDVFDDSVRRLTAGTVGVWSMSVGTKSWGDLRVEVLGCDSRDMDGDGMENCFDGCPTDANQTEPGICGCGLRMLEPGEACDLCPNDPLKIEPGECGCGILEGDC